MKLINNNNDNNNNNNNNNNSNNDFAIQKISLQCNKEWMKQ